MCWAQIAALTLKVLLLTHSATDYENLLQEMCAININLDYYWKKKVNIIVYTV